MLFVVLCLCCLLFVVVIVVAAVRVGNIMIIREMSKDV